MLFHITHTHDHITCPLSASDPEVAFANYGSPLHGNEQVKILGSWISGPSHQVFTILETDDVAAITTLLRPWMSLGDVKVTPVDKFEI